MNDKTFTALIQFEAPNLELARHYMDIEDYRILSISDSTFVSFHDIDVTKFGFPFTNNTKELTTMSVKHLKYTNNTTGETVRAIKVTEKNFQNIAGWIRGTDQSVGRKFAQDAEALYDFDDKAKDVYGQRVKVRTPKGWRVARVGEYVYRIGAYNPASKTNDYDFYVGKDDFVREFTKA